MYDCMQMHIFVYICMYMHPTLGLPGFATTVAPSATSPPPAFYSPPGTASVPPPYLPSGAEAAGESCALVEEKKVAL